MFHHPLDRLDAFAEPSANGRYVRIPAGWNREEFRTPLGVGKSPRNEPAVCRAGLWGFDVLVVPGRAVVKRAALHRMRIRSAFPGDHDRDPGALVGVFDDGGKDQRK
jgi:hypothetical protein